MKNGKAVILIDLCIAVLYTKFTVALSKWTSLIIIRFLVLLGFKN